MNRFLFYLLCFSFAITFTACSDDDDSNANSKLIGTWELVYSKYYEESIWEEELELYERLNFRPTITFKSNGTAIVRDEDYGRIMTEKSNYKYDSKTGKIVFSYTEEDCEDEHSVYFIEFIKENTLKYWEKGFEEYYDIWKKIK